MRVERSLIGVIGISIVLSTLFSLFIVIEQSQEGVTILTNEYPTIPFDQERRFPFALSMMARKYLEEVEIRYTTLTEVEIENATTESTDEETIMMNLPRINALFEEARSLDLIGGVETWDGQVRWTNKTSHRSYELDMYMYEFVDMMQFMAPGRAGIDATSTFVVWINQTNGSIFRYFEGGPFQFNGSRTVEDLTVTINDRSIRYGIVEEGTIAGGDYIPIAQAPMDGTVKFEGVEKDDRLSIDFTLTSPGRMMLFRVYVNGGMETFLSATDKIQILQ